MKIAQIAPLVESVPPKLYGGTERIVSYLTEELIRQGHSVTLFASGDSQTAAELVSCCDRALRLDASVQDPLPYYLLMLEKVLRRASEFDVLHFHVSLLHFPMFRAMAGKTVTTLHGRLDLRELAEFYESFAEMPLVSISDDQRRHLPRRLNWIGTVHHGLPPEFLQFTANPAGDYVAFLGRIAPEKRPDRAIEIASRAGMPLKMAAKIDPTDRRYWEDVIEGMVRSHPNVDFIGEIADSEKGTFIGNARALLFPIDWPEPFGLVMIESMACGTPVIAYGSGSVPEIIEHGVSGFIVQNIEEAVAALRQIDTLDRRAVRRAFDRRFSDKRMADDYLAIYQTLLSRERKRDMPVADEIVEDLPLAEEMNGATITM